jgi:ATP-binding cassette subfamily C protein CydC
MNGKEWIFPYVKENTGLLVLVTLLGLLTVCSSAFLMFTSGFLISKAATRPENLLMIYIPIVAVRTFGIGRAVSRYIERLIGHDLILKILSKMRLKVYQLIEPQVLSPFSAFKTGEVLGMLSDDIERLQDIYLKTVFPGLVGLFLYVISIAALGFYSWPFAVVMAVYAGVWLFLFPFVSLLVTKSKVRKIKHGRHELYGRLTDAVLGLSDWQFSGRQADFIREYEQKEHELALLELKRARFVRWRSSIAQGLVALMVVTMLWWTAGESASGNLGYTFIAAFVLVLFPLTEAFIPLADAVSEIPAYEDSMERLSRLSMTPAKSQQPAAYGHETVRKEHKLGAVLEFHDVSFRYENRQTIDRVTFSLKKGEKMALLGPSGSGKSTILKLIEGVLSPVEGAVMLNGTDIDSIGGEISRRVAVLNQHPHLFDTTIRNNIRLGKPSATDEEVYWAAKQVKLHDYIESLPDGYDTPMHETGMRFSGGERQRIALARILLQDAPIVILDEPTVGLDPLTEKDLMSTIFETLEEKSILWITHHLAFIHLTDQVLFLEKGKIVLNGTHEQLLNTSERYNRLYRLERPLL